MHLEGKGKVIGIIGTHSRNGSDDFNLVREEFFCIYESGDWLCSGDCQKGGDTFALKISRKEGIPILMFPPGEREFGYKKFFRRNDLIAQASDVLIACVIKPFDINQRGGTSYTCRKFLKLHPNGILETI